MSAKWGSFRIHRRLFSRFLGQFHHGFVVWNQDCDHGGPFTEPVTEVGCSGVVVEDGRRGFDREEIGEGLRRVKEVGLSFTHDCLFVDESWSEQWE